ncbi:hypothetical protein [uncultured Aquimarina sp.]|uniref:hypothetical protein n=1 Tax=uncultured Aquimarina sp. TaxID=575652 RepID=UPI00262CA8D7|nr:hypothetical protein [uncultured Aquimarina sp.]
MEKLDQLTGFQLEWLEAVKYDELLQATENHRKNPTSDNLEHWDSKELEYLRVINQIENNQPF